MTINDFLFGVEIKTKKTFMIGWVSKEDTKNRELFDFVGVIKIRITKASEDTKVCV